LGTVPLGTVPIDEAMNNDDLGTVPKGTVPALHKRKTL
jgi:hypothetical protein